MLCLDLNVFSKLGIGEGQFYLTRISGFLLLAVLGKSIFGQIF